jgi:hypothetical protein
MLLGNIKSSKERGRETWWDKAMQSEREKIKVGRH